MPQVPTARGIRIRSAADAHLLFYGVHLKRLPIIQRRLDASERLEVVSGAVFVWEERSASSTSSPTSPFKGDPDNGSGANLISGIERWTDGLKWGPSRVRDDFLFYQEKDPGEKDSRDDYGHHPQQRYHHRHPAERLIKQTYSVHYYPEVLEGKPPTDPPRKWHLTAYQAPSHAELLADVTGIPELEDISPPDGLFKKARVGKKKEGAPQTPQATRSSLAGAASMGVPISPAVSSSPYGPNGTNAHAAGYAPMPHTRRLSVAIGSWRGDHSPVESVNQHSTFPPPSSTPIPPAPGYPRPHDASRPPPPPGMYSGSAYASHHYPPSHDSQASTYDAPRGPATATNGHHHHSASQPQASAYGGPSSSGGYGYPHPAEGYGTNPDHRFSHPPESPHQGHARPEGHHFDPYATPHSHHAPPPGQISSTSNHQIPRYPYRSHSISNSHPGDPPADPHHAHHARSNSYTYQHHASHLVQPYAPQSSVGISHHNRSLSQSSQALPVGMRSPPTGVARIRRGARGSVDLLSQQRQSTTSPPSNGVASTQDGRTMGSGAIGPEGRSHFSPYSRSQSAVGPRQHSAVTSNGASEAPLSYPAHYGSQGAHQDHFNPTRETPTPPHGHQPPYSQPIPPGSHYVPPAHPPHGHGLPTPYGVDPDGRDSSVAAASSYYSSQDPGRLPPHPSPYGSYDVVSKPAMVQAWAASHALPPTQITSLQAQSALPDPARPTMEGGYPQAQQQHTPPIRELDHSPEIPQDAPVGIPALPVGQSGHPAHFIPHPNPNSSPPLRHFQPMSGSLGSQHSSDHTSAMQAEAGGYGSPDLAGGLHRHMAMSLAATSTGMSGPVPVRAGTPPQVAPPRIDTVGHSMAGIVSASPVSATGGGGSVTGSTSSKLGPLTPSTAPITRYPEDERVLAVLSRSLDQGKRSSADDGAGSGAVASDEALPATGE